MRIIKKLSYGLFSLLFLMGCAKRVSFPGGQWIDLSHDFSSETLYWPTAETFQHDTVFSGITDEGFYYQAFNFSGAEHGGTHIDAPVHFAEGKWTVDEIPLDRLIGPAVVMDVTGKALADRDYQVSVEDIVSWESEHGQLPGQSILFLRTGYGRYWPDAVNYMGTDRRGAGAVAELHFPGLHPGAARWLVENRNIRAIGIDTPSIDFGQSELFETHRVLFEKNIPAFENVANLDQLPATGALVLALPMKIKGGSGGPLRLAALVPGNGDD
ncbi:MAG: cyclase family protein [Fidelibacterota bacterium]